MRHMIRIDIRPVWRFRADSEAEFDFQLVAILERIEATLEAHAGRAGGGHLVSPCVEPGRATGRPSSARRWCGRRGAAARGLTPLGERLLWAARRAQARLAPELDNLAAEFARAINDAARRARSRRSSIHASHDFAIGAAARARDRCRRAIEVQYKGSFDALAALRRGECDVAGFHVPEGAARRAARAGATPIASRDGYRLVGFVRRAQGLIVRAGNPKAHPGCRGPVPR